MKINLISYENIRAAVQKAQGDWRKTDRYNTHAHSYSEIAAVIPEDGFKHVCPDLAIGLFSNWAPLILSSQGVTEWYQFNLGNILLVILIGIHNLWMGNRSIRQYLRDSLPIFFPYSTVLRVARESILDGRKWFLRLDFCSTKDGSLGTRPVVSLDDILTSLYTSERAIAALKDIAAGTTLGPARLFLLPYNSSMDQAREFRVFCPPTRERITAISQYRWFQPFYIRDVDKAKRAVERIREGATRIHRQILEHAEGLPDKRVKEKLRSEGFVFDVFETEGGEVQLIEINPFGAMSGCGSCLFHWIKDAKVLYGGKEDVEVRITMRQSIDNQGCSTS